MTTKIGNIQENGQVERQFAIVATGSGLTRTVKAGIFARNDVVTTFSDTDVTVADDDISYVYINTNSLTIVDSTTFPAEDFVMLFEITAASGVITEILDWRSRTSGILDIT